MSESHPRRGPKLTFDVSPVFDEEFRRLADQLGIKLVDLFALSTEAVAEVLKFDEDSERPSMKQAVINVRRAHEWWVYLRRWRRPDGTVTILIPQDEGPPREVVLLG